MRKLALITTTLVLGLTIWAQGPKEQGKKNFEDKAAQRAEYLTIVLDLTDKQVAQFKELQVQNHQKMEEIKGKFQPTMDKMKSELKTLKESSSEDNKEKSKEIREKYKPELEPMKTAMKAEREAQDKAFTSILSKEQAEKHQKLQALKGQNKGQHHRGHANCGNGDKSKRSLSPKGGPNKK